MLEINGVKCEITSQKVFIGTFNKSGENGYNLCIQIEFYNSEIGYINLDVGYEKENNINLFANKEYINDDCTFYEIYDNWLYGNGFNSIVKINDIKDNQVNVSFELSDELMSIKFNGYLVIDNNITKESFMS